MKQKVSREKIKKKIKAEINEREHRKTPEKINETKASYQRRFIELINL